jgi:hypothetical protein
MTGWAMVAVEWEMALVAQKDLEVGAIILGMDCKNIGSARRNLHNCRPAKINPLHRLYHSTYQVFPN